MKSELFSANKKNGKQFMLKIIMYINKRKNKSKITGYDPDGQLSLDFILILPLLILIVLAVSHFGLVIFQKNILEQAAREGVRVIATTNSNQEAYACIKEVCSNLDHSRLEIKVSPESRASRKVGDM